VYDSQLCGNLGNRKPVAFDASADERKGPAIISITTIRRSQDSRRIGYSIRRFLSDLGITAIQRRASPDTRGRSASALSHSNRVAGVHAHGIEVLNRADDDHIVFRIAHHPRVRTLSIHTAPHQSSCTGTFPSREPALPSTLRG